jgi:cell division protein FtsB
MTETITRQRTDKPRRSRVAPVVAVLLLAALAFTVSGVFPFRQLFQQQRQVADTQERLQDLTDANDQLEADIEAMQTDDGIERIAREQYGLVRPGEDAYVVVVPDTASDSSTVPTEDPTPAAPWWQRMWNFLTGGDVPNDG